MDSKLKMYCKLCQAPKSAKRRNYYDEIERTTECHLKTEAGAVLKIRETKTSLDEEAIWNKMSCQCNAPVFGKSGENSQKEILEETRNKSKKINCGKAIQELKPKWYHQFTEEQYRILDGFVWDLIDDSDEGTQYRVQQALHFLGLYPQPSFKQIQKAMIFNSTNSVLFLDDLLKILKHSENDGKFSYNQRVLMSGIFYLEMPYLLQTLLQRLSHESEDLLPPREIIGFKKEFSQNPNPYLQPVWPRKFQNWQNQRKKSLALRREYCKSRQRICCPAEAWKENEFLTHIDEGPLPDNESRDTKSSRFPDKSFETILKATLSELELRGMISASYPKIKNHPVLVHLEKFINGEVITRQLKSNLVQKAKTMKHCIKKLYKPTHPENLNKILPDKTWALIKPLRETSTKERKKFLDHLWRQRVECAQNLWSTLSPEYPQVRSFLQEFSAYATSHKTGTNLWTVVPKEA